MTRPPDSDFKRKVDIFVAGFQKCGTSALCDLLDRHPNVGVCRPKEPAWFSGGKLARSEDEYLSLFPQDKPLWVDGSTAYSFPEHAADVAQRIRQHNPTAVFVFIVRNPLNRVRSALNHAMLENTSNSTPNMVIQRATRRSTYYDSISQFKSHFPKKSILVTSMDELLSTNGRMVTEFLGLQPVGEHLREVNYTANRRKENVVTAAYRRHWKAANRLPVPKSIRNLLARANSKYFMQSPRPEEFYEIPPEWKKNIVEYLVEDSQLFDQAHGFDYMSLHH